jgi:hypothetical protein
VEPDALDATDTEHRQRVVVLQPSELALQHADLSPKAASDFGNYLVELAAQAEEGQVVRVHIASGGAVGRRGLSVVAELRATGERAIEQNSGLGQCSGMTPEASVSVPM